MRRARFESRSASQKLRDAENRAALLNLDRILHSGDAGSISAAVTTLAALADRLRRRPKEKQWSAAEAFEAGRKIQDQERSGNGKGAE